MSADVATVPVLAETTDSLLLMRRKKLQEKDYSASRLPATLSLHVNRSPQQVIDSPDSPNPGLQAIRAISIYLLPSWGRARWLFLEEKSHAASSFL
jgi:hypothetical protein